MRNAYAVRRPVANPYLVRERDRRRQRELGLVLLVILPLGLSLIGYVWLHVEVLQVGYRVQRLERELERELRRERLLQLEAAHLASPRQLERRAVEELGMVHPDLSQVIFEEEVR